MWSTFGKLKPIRFPAAGRVVNAPARQAVKKLAGKKGGAAKGEAANAATARKAFKTRWKTPDNESGSASFLNSAGRIMVGGARQIAQDADRQTSRRPPSHG